MNERFVSVKHHIGQDLQSKNVLFEVTKSCFHCFDAVGSMTKMTSSVLVFLAIILKIIYVS